MAANRQTYQDAMRRRQRVRTRLEQRRRERTNVETAAATSRGRSGRAPTLYGASACVHAARAMASHVERQPAGGWLMVYIGRGEIYLLTTAPFCDGDGCEVDHVRAAGKLVDALRRRVSRKPLLAAGIRTGGAWPWPNELPPGAAA